jgi:hypothetical protein
MIVVTHLPVYQKETQNLSSWPSMSSIFIELNPMADIYHKRKKVFSTLTSHLTNFSSTYTCGAGSATTHKCVTISRLFFYNIGGSVSTM